MNYYEKHLGDYSKDASHLSILEHGVYNLLMDRYYSAEQGIPEADKYRKIRATSAEERAAVDAVLQEFFRLDSDGVWRKNRIEEEIAKARQRIETARVNGRKGGRRAAGEQSGGDPVTGQEPSGNPVGLGSLTETLALHTPDTIHQEDSVPNGTGAEAPIEPPDSKSKAKPKARKPEDPVKREIWDTGLRLLLVGEVKRDSVGSFLQAQIKTYGQPVVLEAVRACASCEPAPFDAKEYIVACCKRVVGARPQPVGSHAQQRVDLMSDLHAMRAEINGAPDEGFHHAADDYIDVPARTVG